MKKLRKSMKKIKIRGGKPDRKKIILSNSFSAGISQTILNKQVFLSSFIKKILTKRKHLNRLKALIIPHLKTFLQRR